MYFENLERYAHIVYPALALLVVILVIAGILQAWQTNDLDGLARVEIKREIMLELRRQVGGVPADVLSRAVDLEPLKTMQLLEEMQRDGVLVSHTNTSHLTIWRMKGVGGALQEPTPARAPRPAAIRRAPLARGPRRAGPRVTADDAAIASARRR